MTIFLFFAKYGKIEVERNIERRFIYGRNF